MGKKEKKQARTRHGGNKREGALGHARQFRTCRWVGSESRVRLAEWLGLYWGWRRAKEVAILDRGTSIIKGTEM